MIGYNLYIYKHLEAKETNESIIFDPLYWEISVLLFAVYYDSVHVNQREIRVVQDDINNTSLLEFVNHVCHNHFALPVIHFHKLVTPIEARHLFCSFHQFVPLFYPNSRYGCLMLFVALF